jgi:hypothetical protein
MTMSTSFQETLKIFRKQIVHCIHCEVSFQTRCHLAYLPLKKKLGVVAHFREEICHWCAKMWARKNKNRPLTGFFTETAYVQVMNFIPAKVSTLYISLYH